MFFGNSADRPNALAQAKTTATPKQQVAAGSDTLTPETDYSGGLSRSSSLSDRLRSSWKGGVSSLLKKSQDDARADALAKARRSKEPKVTTGAETGKAQPNLSAKSKGKEPVELPAPDKLRKHTTDSMRTTNSSVVDPAYSPRSKRFRTADNPPLVPSKSPLPQETSFFDDSSSDEDDQSPVLQRASSVRVGKPMLVRHTSNAAASHVVKHEYSPAPRTGLSKDSTATESRADKSGPVSQSATVRDTETEPTSQVSSSWGQGPEDALSRLEGTRTDTNPSPPQFATKPLPLTPATSIPAAQYSPSKPLVASPITYTTFPVPPPTPSSIASSTTTTPPSSSWAAPTLPPTAHPTTSAHGHQQQPISIPFPTPLSPLSALHSNPVSPSTATASAAAAAAAAALRSPASRLSRALSAPTHPGTPPNRNPNRRVTIRPSDLVIVHSEHDHRLFRKSVVTTPYPERGVSSDQEGSGGHSGSQSGSESGRWKEEGRVGRSRSVGGGAVGMGFGLGIDISSSRGSGRGGRRTGDGYVDGDWEGRREGGSSIRKGTALTSSKNANNSSNSKNRLSDITDDDDLSQHHHRSGGDERRSEDDDDNDDKDNDDDRSISNQRSGADVDTHSTTIVNRNRNRPTSTLRAGLASHQNQNNPHQHVRLLDPSPMSRHGPGDRDRFPSLSSSESLFLVLSIAGHPNLSVTVEVEVPPNALAVDLGEPSSLGTRSPLGPGGSAAGAGAGSAAESSHGPTTTTTANTSKGLFTSLRTRFSGTHASKASNRNRNRNHNHARNRLSKPHPSSTPPPFDDAHLFTHLSQSYTHSLFRRSPLLYLLAPTRTLHVATPASPDGHDAALDSTSFVAHLKNPSLGRGMRGWLLWLRNQQQQQGGIGGEGSGSPPTTAGSPVSAAAAGGAGAIYPRMPLQRTELRGREPPRVVLGYRFNYGVIASAVLGWVVVGAVVVVVWVLVGVPGGRVGAGGDGIVGVGVAGVNGTGDGGMGMGVGDFGMGELRMTRLGGDGAVHRNGNGSGNGEGYGTGDWKVDSQMRVLTGLVLGGGVSAAGLVVTGLWVLGGWVLL